MDVLGEGARGAEDTARGDEDTTGDGEGDCLAQNDSNQRHSSRNGNPGGVSSQKIPEKGVPGGGVVGWGVKSAQVR
ncbi:hypothetical protein GCM10028815_18380 [Mariniluteicoccus flavus]